MNTDYTVTARKERKGTHIRRIVVSVMKNGKLVKTGTVLLRFFDSDGTLIGSGDFSIAGGIVSVYTDQRHMKPVHMIWAQPQPWDGGDNTFIEVML